MKKTAEEIREERRRYYREHKDMWKRYRENKGSKYPLYTLWHGMLVRVGVRPGAKDHEVKDYIERGIGICEEWKTYENFEKWALSNGWKKELRIDRIDNNKGYSPENCRFTTVSGNQRNRRCNLWCEYKGERMLLIEAYEKSGSQLEYVVVNTRFRRGWKLMDALFKPMDMTHVAKKCKNQSSKSEQE